MASQSPTPDMDRIKETLKKLAILAERGENNERETALLLLQKILLKYNLSVPDLVSPDIKEREFSFTSRDNLTILAQCIWSVNKDAHISFDSGRNKVFVKLRSSDYIEVVEKVQFYFPLYEKEKMKLMLAFICKHGLTTDTTSCQSNENMSEQEVRQIVVMMQGMDKSSFVTSHKMIEKK